MLGWKTLPTEVVEGSTLQLQTGAGDQAVTVVNTADPQAQEFARRAIDVVLALPDGAPAPRLLWWFDEEIGAFGRWIVAAWFLPDIRAVGDGWSEPDVAGALDILHHVGEVEAPETGPFLDSAVVYDAGPWRRLADERPDGLRHFSPWLGSRLDALAEIAAHSAEAVSGRSLVHGAPSRHTLYLPSRPDGRGLAAGWPQAARGAPFVDTVLLLAHIRADGGPAPEVVLARHRLLPDADPDAVTCMVTALTGQLIERALQPGRPAPGHLPSVRQASVCVEWLRRRLGF
ncbi:hypothetical protein GCM10028784_04650 [Myceligenerans cantabricum]